MEGWTLATRKDEDAPKVSEQAMRLGTSSRFCSSRNFSEIDPTIAAPCGGRCIEFSSRRSEPLSSRTRL